MVSIVKLLNEIFLPFAILNHHYAFEPISVKIIIYSHHSLILDNSKPCKAKL